MSRTCTRYVNFEAFAARGTSAVTVVKLMMACNDLSLVNQALFDWKQDQSSTRKSQQIGAKMYFVRTQLAHLHEGMKVLDAIRADPVLVAIVDQCDKQTKDSFQELQRFLPGGVDRNEFELLVGRVRHNVGFHYDESGKLIQKAILDRAQRAEARIASITRGSTAYLWRFNAADDIVDSVVVRQIWSIPRGADVRVEADKIADRVHQIFLWFVDFSGEFIWKYCAD